MSKNHIVIMAGGSGKRMGHNLPKQLLTVGHAPMLVHLLDLANRLQIDTTLVLSESNRDIVIDHLIGSSALSEYDRDSADQIYSYKSIRVWIGIQEVADGTGGAIRTARDQVFRSDRYNLDRDIRHNILVLSADVPLLSERSASTMLKMLSTQPDLKCVIYAQERENPFGYGRVLLDPRGYINIIEQKDIYKDVNNKEELNKVKLINTGIYAFESESLFEALDRVDNQNAQNEYYLTAVPEIIQDKEGPNIIYLYRSPDFPWDETMGANTPDQLEAIKSEYRKKFQLRNLVTQTIMSDEILRDYLSCLAELTSIDIDLNSVKELDRTREFLKKYSETNNKHVFVIFYEERVIGTFSIVVEPKTIHGLAAVAHVEDVVIMSEFRRSGLGTLSLNFCKEFCASYEENYGLRVYKIILECADKVLGFYEHNEFRHAGNSMRYDM